jgi:hypothetical protein
VRSISGTKVLEVVVLTYLFFREQALLNKKKSKEGESKPDSPSAKKVLSLLALLVQKYES